MQLHMKLISIIDDMVEEHDIDYMDAVLTFCEEHKIDVEVIGELISKNAYLRSKIEEEAESLHFIKKTNRLPI